MALSKADAIKILKEHGAENVIKEDRFGDTKAGWWLDDVFLGKDPVLACSVILG